jgi:uncharacterized protein YecE (DUF72 family)
LLGQGRSGIFSRWAQKQEPCRSIFLTHSTLNLYVKAHQKMTQPPIVAYLSLKEMSAREIYDNIVATLGPMLCYTVQLPATFARHDFLLWNQNPIQPTFKEISMIPIRLF